MARSLSAGVRVALQSVLGSDPRREELNIMRVAAVELYGIRGPWARRWNLLFESKLTP